MFDIEVEKLAKHFGDFVAVDSLSFNVEHGEIFGLLGPNGAGKSTLIRMLTTLVPPTSGTARVNHFDIVRQADGVRQSIGVIPQAMTSDLELSAWENLTIFAKLYGIPREKRNRTIKQLLREVDLEQWADKPVKMFSGGMRRRLEIARGLVHEPKIFFLDEPTAGLDPRSRLVLWDIIRSLVADGTTVLLTTQYLEEADQLADRVVVIDKGAVIAQGSSDELKAQVGGDRIGVTVAAERDLAAAREVLARYAQGEVHTDPDRRVVDALVPTGAGCIPAIAAAMSTAGVVMDDVGMLRPSLDDVFLTLTGHSAGPAAIAGEKVEQLV